MPPRQLAEDALLGFLMMFCVGMMIALCFKAGLHLGYEIGQDSARAARFPTRPVLRVVVPDDAERD